MSRNKKFQEYSFSENERHSEGKKRGKDRTGGGNR